MSIDYSIYVGAYARCTTKKVEELQPYSTCLSPTCKYHGRSLNPLENFCSNCGNRVSITHKKTARPEVDLVMEACNENLYPSSTTVESGSTIVHIWLGNRLDDECHYTFNPEQATTAEVFDQYHSLDEIHTFRRFYAKELDFLRKAYGDENVEVVCGMVNEIR